MAYNKEELDALLKFIIDICNKDENKWFKEELIKVLGCEQKHSQAFVAFGEGLTTRINDIEHYLGLDYKIDSAKSIINYDRIIGEGYKVKLRQDNREMLRYRYGTRGHVIDFLEFCKFAHMQAEALLNYFYESLNENFEETLEYIESRMPKNFSILGKEKKKQVSDISYNDKKIAFCEEFNSKLQQYPLSFHFNDILDYIRQARNFLSHRSGQKEDDSWKDYFKKYILKSGLPVKDMDFDWYKILNNESLKQRYNSHFKEDKKYKEYRYNHWISQKPFDEVIWALSKMAEIIQSEIIEA